MTQAEEIVWQSLAARGDRSAWECLFESAYDAVAAYIHWRCAGQVDLADDVRQETWLLAARKVASFDPKQGRFAGWVCGLAANVLRNQLRGKRRRLLRYSPLQGHEAAPVAQADPDDHALRVAQALAELPERYEAVLRAKYLEQLSVAEIARQWHETPKAIESLLSRAREAFRNHYQNPTGES